MNTNDFYTNIMAELTAGKSIDDIAKALTDSLNKAKADMEAQTVKAQKMEYVRKLAALVSEYMTKFAPDVSEDFDLTDEDAETIMEALDETIDLLRSAKSIIKNPNTIKFGKADSGISVNETLTSMFDEIYAEIDKLKRNPINLKSKPNPDFKPPVHKAKTDDEVISEFLDKILN